VTLSEWKSCLKQQEGPAKSRGLNHQFDTLRFWHRFLSIPLIRYFRQAWARYAHVVVMVDMLIAEAKDSKDTEKKLGRSVMIPGTIKQVTVRW
jgi:hypothetical protein